MSGKADYDLTSNLEMWSDKDLIEWIFDTELMMGMEKHQLVLLAQEAGARWEPYADDGTIEEDDDNSREYND